MSGEPLCPDRIRLHRHHPGAGLRQWDCERAGASPEIEDQLAGQDSGSHPLDKSGVYEEVLTEATTLSVPGGAPRHGDAP